MNSYEKKTNNKNTNEVCNAEQKSTRKRNNKILKTEMRFIRINQLIYDPSAKLRLKIIKQWQTFFQMWMSIWKRS